MTPFLLIVSLLCLSTGYSIVYRMSPRDHATVTGTPAQDEAAMLAAERDRFDELVADLDFQTSRRHQDHPALAHRHSVNTITSDALDALYAERDRLREQLDQAPQQATDPADDLVAALVEQAVGQAAELHVQLADVETKRVGVYRERAHLLGWLASLHHHNAFLTAATDVDEPGWKLLHLNIAGHKLSWHIAPPDVELLDHVMTVPFADPRWEWDGSTTDEKYQHIRSLAFSQKSMAVHTPAPPAHARSTKAASAPATGHSSTRTTATQPNVDALLDAYADRGTVIQQAIRLVDSVLDAPSVDAAEQRPMQDFAHKIRNALLSAAPKTDT
ncbi:hypothetical protein GCM10022403_071860 [Streptomyces coacervatus]|uniref:Secreted protein n=1 Tax=Streptomyces coacervatus TaxID=647381 RepID=A0ABP7IWT8_9ACTN|nr:hypothetical protein [Streptomyces coacervatus]MDF2269691.1 hypothetical protein [Streptomyces coacervatus]